MEPRPLRLAYAIEFFIALIAFFECWSQMGGQTPLDLMPWWLKLVLAVVFGAVVVRLTAVAVQQEPFPPIRMIRWSLALLMVLVIVALTTYFYYLREPTDDDSVDEPVTSSLLTNSSACG